MLVHSRVIPSFKFAGTHLYAWVERGTVGVKCLAQEYNTTSPARARTRTAQSGDERTNHEATAPPTTMKYTAIDCTDRGRHLKEIVAFMLKNRLHEELSSEPIKPEPNTCSWARRSRSRRAGKGVRELCTSELRLVLILDYFWLDDSVVRASSASRLL